MTIYRVERGVKTQRKIIVSSLLIRLTTLSSREIQWCSYAQRKYTTARTANQHQIPTGREPEIVYLNGNRGRTEIRLLYVRNLVNQRNTIVVTMLSRFRTTITTFAFAK